MKHLIYFLPGDIRMAQASHLEAAGLAHAIDGAEQGLTSLRHESGPGGTGGILVCVNDAEGKSPHPEYDASRQTWRKGPGGKYFVGFWNDQKPGPEDLQHEQIYAGQAVKLLDGNTWIVPRCYASLKDRSTTLPMVFDLDEDGETLLGKTHPRYAALSQKAFDVWRAWSRQTNGKPDMTFAEEVNYAAEALAVNYRVGKVEAIGLLGLFDTDTWRAVIRATIDADEVERYFTAQADQELADAEKKAVAAAT